MKLLVTAGPHARNAVGTWLFVSAAWVFSMVVLGGVTRLTRSGLSMTDWKFTGGLPPLTEEEWLIEFDKYKQSPEYKRLVSSVFGLLFSVLFARLLVDSGFIYLTVEDYFSRILFPFNVWFLGFSAVHFMYKSAGT